MYHNLPNTIVQWRYGIDDYIRWNVTHTSSDVMTFGKIETSSGGGEEFLDHQRSTKRLTLAAGDVRTLLVAGVQSDFVEYMEHTETTNQCGRNTPSLYIFTFMVFLLSAATRSKMWIFVVLALSVTLAVADHQECFTSSFVITAPSTVRTVCENGACRCMPGWYGDACDDPNIESEKFQFFEIELR